MKFLFKIFLPFLFLALVSCQQEPLPADSLAYEGLKDEYMQEPLRQKELDQDQEKPEPDQAELERKLIKEGHVEFETEEVEEPASEFSKRYKNTKLMSPRINLIPIHIVSAIPWSFVYRQKILMPSWQLFPRE